MNEDSGGKIKALTEVSAFPLQPPATIFLI
jgi:hypothetical protein